MYYHIRTNTGIFAYVSRFIPFPALRRSLYCMGTQRNYWTNSRIMDSPSLTMWRKDLLMDIFLDRILRLLLVRFADNSL